jgi:hypothetical protein
MLCAECARRVVASFGGDWGACDSCHEPISSGDGFAIAGFDLITYVALCSVCAPAELMARSRPTPAPPRSCERPPDDRAY